jgi:catechol 2,3-dioxygenase-like lactoylglutathione lyase family enzyme
MLGDHDTIATLAVKDIQVARDFYERVLGCTVRGDAPDGVLYAAGTGAFLVYPSSFAGTNKATAMSFQVPLSGFDAEIAALRDKGVAFQTFDAPGISWDDGVASMGGDARAVWFEDPDGNILNVETGVSPG